MWKLAGLEKESLAGSSFSFPATFPSRKAKSFLPKSCLGSPGIGEQFLRSFSQSEFSPSDLRVRIVYLNLKKAVLIDASHSLSLPQKASDFVSLGFPHSPYQISDS